MKPVLCALVATQACVTPLRAGWYPTTDEGELSLAIVNEGEAVRRVTSLVVNGREIVLNLELVPGRVVVLPFSTLSLPACEVPVRVVVRPTTWYDRVDIVGLPSLPATWPDALRRCPKNRGHEQQPVESPRYDVPRRQ
jgi:hypothetical protein